MTVRNHLPWVAQAPTVMGLCLLAGAWWTARTGSVHAAQFFKEDGLVEWLQFLAFAALSALCAFFAVEARRHAGRLVWTVLVLAACSAVAGVAALEEVSWFQRVLGLSTPEYFMQHNRQGETNLHNLKVGESSLNKAILVKLMLIVGLVHNLVLPLWTRWVPSLQDRVEALGLYVPPLSMAMGYLALVVLSHLALDHPRKGELGEVFGALHYLTSTFLAYGLGVGYRRAPVFGAADRTRIAALFGLFSVHLVAVAWLLGSLARTSG